MAIKSIQVLILFTYIVISSISSASENELNHEQQPLTEMNNTHEEANIINLSAASMQAANIVVEPLVLRQIKDEIQAPGEVKLNTYLSSKVTPRITAQIVERHVQLGDEVQKGQALVTLSSVAMAQAVSEFLIARTEWLLVKKLGKAAASAKRYSQATVTYTQLEAKLISYGMTAKQVKKIGINGSQKVPGNFQLLAPQTGRIMSDDFIEGELIEPGRILFDIADESLLWVESYLTPQLAKQIEIGNQAHIHTLDDKWVTGKVVQKHHMLDKETRTIGVRIAVSNQDDTLHPGVFVNTLIQIGDGEKYLALPTEAILRSSDGDWVIFIEQQRGQFKAIEIQVIKQLQNYSVITGVAENMRVVTRGAFFVQSELAKAGFNVHNH